jgi:hypothetical protein
MGWFGGHETVELFLLFIQRVAMIVKFVAKEGCGFVCGVDVIDCSITVDEERFGKGRWFKKGCERR